MRNDVALPVGLSNRQPAALCVSFGFFERARTARLSTACRARDQKPRQQADLPMAVSLSRVPCEGGVQIAVHHFGGQGPSCVILAANGFMPQAYLPLVRVDS